MNLKQTCLYLHHEINSKTPHVSCSEINNKNTNAQAEQC